MCYFVTPKKRNVKEEIEWIDVYTRQREIRIEKVRVSKYEREKVENEEEREKERERIQ